MVKKSGRERERERKRKRERVRERMCVFYVFVYFVKVTKPDQCHRPVSAKLS